MEKIIRKADEMEMAINLKAARNSHVFLTVSAMTYCVIEFINTGELPLMFLFVTVSGAIFWLTKLIETSRLTKQSEEDEE